MNINTRSCPSCGITIHYKNEKLLKQAIKRNSKCRRVCLGKVNNPDNKICHKCKKEKNKKEFGIEKGDIKRCCKSCERKRNREFYAKNKESRKISCKKWHNKNPNYSKEYYKNNTQKELEKTKRWLEKNPNYHENYRTDHKKEIKVRNKRWQKNNPDKVRATARKYRAKVRELDENYSSNDEAITKKEFGHRCFNCGKNYDLTIDHHRPLSKNNPLTLGNAVLLCQSCNSSKGAKDPKNFYTKEAYNKLIIKLAEIVSKYS